MLCPCPLQVYEAMAELLEGEVPKPASDLKAEEGADAAPHAPPLSPFGGEQGALVWLQYVRFLRRTQGIPAARMVRRGGLMQGG